LPNFEKDIDSFLETMAENIVLKAQYREEFGRARARLTILMAQYIDKSSASFENKIQLLLKTPEIQKEVENLSNIYSINECLYKNYRDFAELYRLKIIELQSRRKSQRQDHTGL